jgi:molecular chaperone GrpE
MTDTPEADISDADASATVETLMARISELDDLWRRAAADLDNLRKRNARLAEQQRADERDRVTAAMLPVLDNLDLALAHADADPTSVIDGVRAVRDQAISVLSMLGYQRHDETGEPFDPTKHEAVAVVEDPQAPSGTVVRVVRPGYGDGDSQLRPASVMVAAGSR